MTLHILKLSLILMTHDIIKNTILCWIFTFLIFEFKLGL